MPVKNDAGKIIGGEEIELDIVAESEDKKSLLVGECKWNAPDYADRLLRVLQTKVASIPQFANYEKVEYVLFLREHPLDESSLDKLTVHILYPEDIIKLI